MAPRYPESFEAALADENHLALFWDAVALLKTDFVAGMAKFGEVAKLGSVLSMYMLGDIYFWGFNGLGHRDAGLAWLRRAAEEGSIEAAYQLGRAHRGLQKEDAAIDVLTKLSGRGFSPAMFELGVIYSCRKDFRMCEKFYQESADLGNFHARKNLGLMMSKGYFGVSRMRHGIGIWTNLVRDYKKFKSIYPESDCFRGTGIRIREFCRNPVTRPSLLLLN